MHPLPFGARRTAFVLFLGVCLLYLAIARGVLTGGDDTELFLLTQDIAARGDVQRAPDDTTEGVGLPLVAVPSYWLADVVLDPLLSLRTRDDASGNPRLDERIYGTTLINAPIGGATVSLTYLLALAHYEWIELVLGISNKETPLDQIDTDGDLAVGYPALNPVLALLQYQYPVQRIGPKFKPLAPPPQPTYLLVFRDPEFQVEFIELNPVAARLVDLLQHGAPGDSASAPLLQQIAQELDHPEPQVVIQGGLDILRKLHAAGAILGTWRQ